MAMSIEQVLAAREELQAQQARLLERVDEIVVERERIRAEEDPAPDWARASQLPRLPGPTASRVALAQARVDAMRGVDGAAGEVERLEARIADVEERVKAGDEAERVANDALEAVRDDLARLYVEEAEAWFAYAEPFTRRAHELLDALRGPMADALSAWQEATVVWAPIAAANGLRPVQRCPLPELAAIFGASGRPGPTDGAPVMFRPVDPVDEREPMQAIAGTGTYDALSTDGSWEQVGGQAAHAAPVARPADLAPLEEASAA